MKLNNSTASIFVPDGQPVDTAIARTTHLGIGAHQDDLEFMALHGILECFQKEDKWFGGVTCTNGSGSARSGDYASFTDEDMMAIRRQEQETASVIGQFSFIAQLDYPSSGIKNPPAEAAQADLTAILAQARPDVVYTHNLADKHDTHVGVVITVLQAIRALPADQRPARVLGCEVWRDLDWLMDAEKVPMDVSAHENLAASLNGVFDSQIAGGKRYDLAVMGRRRANATFYESHATDEIAQLWFAMDLTPLAQDDNLDMVEFVDGHIQRFREDVRQKLSKRLGA
jgi:LmbE family N-acetylglucosaminyl deacetylase